MGFSIPVQTSFSQARPITTTPWVRPADWITITDAPNIVQFLVSDVVYPAYSIQTTFTQTGGVGNIYIDWGDGTSTTVSTTTATNSEKVYSSGGTYSTQGYNTWKITISGDAGTRITAASFVNPTYWGSGVQQPSGLLEDYYGDGTITTPALLHYNATTKPLFTNLVYSKLPSVITGSVTLQNSYVNCYNLRTVIMPTSMSGLTDMTLTFGSCYSLQSVTLPQDATAITSMNQAFSLCYSLTGVTFPPTLNSVNSLLSAFQNCYSLKNIVLPATPNNSNYATTFNGCNSLLSVEISTFGTAASIDVSNMFLSCRSLEYVKLPTTVSASSVFNAASMFASCVALKSCIFPTNFNASSLASTFLSCSSLSYISLPSSMPSLTTMLSTFNGCSDLSDITLPTTVGASIDLGSTFASCLALSTVTIPSGWTITNLASTFTLCSNLRTVTLPSGAQNSLTSMATTFNGCTNLNSVVLPSSMTSLNTLSQTFNNCFCLTGVTYPSALNAVTTMGNIHTNNYRLQSVTLPTSMSVCASFAGAFNGCWKLQSVTFPSTIAATTTTFQNLCLNNYALKTAVLPTTQSTSVTTTGGSNMFQNCTSLTGITNTDKIGNTSGAGAIVDATNYAVSSFEVSNILTFTCRLSKVTVNGTSTRLSKLPGLRLSNTGTGQWGGTSPQIDISYTSLSTASINLLFADMAAQGTVTSKTINITGASGAAGLTAADRLVITSKGWTITG